MAKLTTKSRNMLDSSTMKMTPKPMGKKPGWSNSAPLPKAKPMGKKGC
jgi:hypothetical protein